MRTSGDLLIGSSIRIAVNSYRAVPRLIILRIVTSIRRAVPVFKSTAESSRRDESRASIRKALRVS